MAEDGAEIQELVLALFGFVYRYCAPAVHTFIGSLIIPKNLTPFWGKEDLTNIAGHVRQVKTANQILIIPYATAMNVI
jgi:hypothetical protein